MLAIIGLTAVSAILIPTYAVPSIRSADIVDGEVKTVDLAKGAIQLNVHILQKDTLLDNGEFGTVEVNCESGEILTGGGVLSTGVTVEQSWPKDADTWQVGARDIAGDPALGSFAAYALCIDPTIP